jgi:hypothetical protein
MGASVAFACGSRSIPPAVGPPSAGAHREACDEMPATPRGPQPWVRARFGDFITPWIEAWQLKRAG